MALAINTTLDSNVAFNMPRAGFNFNDGLGGGHVVTRNVLFSTVRTTSDHGCINTCVEARVRGAMIGPR